VGDRATTGGVALSPKDVGEAQDLRPIITTWDKGFRAGEVAESLCCAFKTRHQDTVGGNVDNAHAIVAGVRTTCTRQRATGSGGKVSNKPTKW
jgi:hypothetical protein